MLLYTRGNYLIYLILENPFQKRISGSLSLGKTTSFETSLNYDKEDEIKPEDYKYVNI
jgi:hypothetical protein